MKGSDIFKVLPKKEAMSIDKEIEKLQKHMGGIKDMDRLSGRSHHDAKKSTSR